VALGLPAALLLFWVRGDAGRVSSTDFLVTFFLLTWPLFVVTYLAWTHASYALQGPRRLRAIARAEAERLRHRWVKVIGYGGASSWTLSGALVAVLLTVVIAQAPQFHDDWIFVALGLLAVASSWVLMVYSFALGYLRLAVGEPGAARHLHVEPSAEPLFVDFLTFAVLLSAMAATTSATPLSRRAWTLVRVNVIFAFAFNSVIVAMMVSLLFGGLLT
jgi:uncharacterized membrane protein